MFLPNVTKYFSTYSPSPSVLPTQQALGRGYDRQASAAVEARKLLFVDVHSQARLADAPESLYDGLVVLVIEEPDAQHLPGLFLELMIITDEAFILQELQDSSLQLGRRSGHPIPAHGNAVAYPC
jgi:hypothetical protein